jgi:hypothetical protein
MRGLSMLMVIGTETGHRRDIIIIIVIPEPSISHHRFAIVDLRHYRHIVVIVIWTVKW